MNKNQKVTFIAFIIIAFIFLVIGGLGTIIGATIKENRLLYLGLVFLSIGFVLYAILFFILLYSVSKAYRNKEKEKENIEEENK